LRAPEHGQKQSVPFRRRSPDPPDAPTQPLPRVEGERYGYGEEPVVEEEVVERPRRRPPVLWPYLLVLLLLVVGGLGALWWFSRDEGEKPVPSVVRLPEGDAVQQLDDEGFSSQILRRRTDKAEQGIVFAQQPSAGRELEEGSTVTLLVSSGPATVEVPDVTGLPVDRAEDELGDAGLEARRVSVFSEEEPGVVVAQDPGGDERAPRNSSVRLNVSKGTGRVEVPDVVGRTAGEAGSILREAGLDTPRIVTVPSEQPKGTVVAQSPVPGSQIAKGKAIRINVSDGTGAAQTGEIEVPDVSALAEEDAIQTLEDDGFTVRIRREETNDPSQVGVVLRQEPRAGTTLARGDEVAIVVGEAAG
jgi:eukaryotic-like serine/threonine-protein kinase